MRTQHEKEEETISMCLIGGLFIVGTLVGGNKVLEPRVVNLFEEQSRDPQGNPITIPKMRMSPLPGNPPYLISNRMSLVYPIPKHDKNTLELYKRVTAQIPKSVIVTPEGHPELN